MQFTATDVSAREAWLETWGFFGFGLLLLVELARLALRGELRWNILGDAITNFVTLGFFVVLTYGFFAAAYVAGFYWFQANFALAEVPVNAATVVLVVVLCDLAYYWEHRFVHRNGLGWATHTVHHSSPCFNISVAYRFGPFDGIWPFFFHVPLVILGFDPLLVFAGEAFVQLYQTVLHTEVVRKLPRPMEWLMNTPSHHRVHHGSNPEYLDRNYGGIFIVWDRLFGTFADEREPVIYGLTEPVRSINPFVVFCHGIERLVRRTVATRTLGDALYSLVAPPEWQPRRRDEEMVT